MKLPDFICVGAQKSGTTTLHVLLNKHPKVFLPATKELHYFDLNYDRGKKWYSDQFSLAAKGQICGEITPFYLFHKSTPNRIKLLIPNVKLIILLRDPVNRTISHIFHAQKRGYENEEIEKALELEEERLASGNLTIIQRHSYVARSRYMNQLLRYENKFNKHQLLILKSEDLFKAPKIIWNRIIKFLDIHDSQPPKTIPIANKGLNYKNLISDKTRNKLRNTLEETYIDVKRHYGINWEEQHCK